MKQNAWQVLAFVEFRSNLLVGLHRRHSPTPDGYFGSFLGCCLLNQRRFWLFR